MPGMPDSQSAHVRGEAVLASWLRDPVRRVSVAKQCWRHGYVTLCGASPWRSSAGVMVTWPLQCEITLARLPLLARSFRSVSSSPALSAAPSGGPSERVHKPPSPWEAASRHPLGLVDEAFAFQSLQQSLASSLRSAADRKQLPTPPPEWTARVSYDASMTRSLSPASSTLSRTYSSALSRSHAPPRSPQPFLSPTKSSASEPASGALYSAPYRQTPPLRSLTEVSLGPSWARPSPAQTHAHTQSRYRSSYTWRR
ncbi:uncharacterized protein LOC143127841 [Alosa pseudoharengus]|uniref:uncharacterized protein LOC143127841 n=1 Tax=Alosa pseudoharengus TaxID=34774 RepID=UPI003F897CE2